MDRLDPFPRQGTGQMDFISGVPIDSRKPFCLTLFSEVCLIKADHHRNILGFHRDQKAVQKVQIRFRVSNGKHDHCLIDVRHRRTDQGILPRKDLHDISEALLLRKHVELHIVAHKGLDLPIPEYALCLTLVYFGNAVMHVIESGNSLYDLSSQPSTSVNVTL